MIPVNITRYHQVWADPFHRPVLNPDDVLEGLHSFGPKTRHFPAADDLWGDENNHFINDSAPQGIESQIRSALEQEALDIPSGEIGCDFMQVCSSYDDFVGVPKVQVRRLCVDDDVGFGKDPKARVKSAAAIQDGPDQGASASPSAAIGQERIIGKNRPASGYQRVDGVSQLLDDRPGFFGSDPARLA